MKRKMSKEEAKWRKRYVRELAKKEKAEEALRLVEEHVLGNAKMHGRALTEMDRHTCRRQSRCNHLKGGYIRKVGTTLSFPEIGNCDQYAVIKHQMIHGDIWVRCLRCGKWWKPPIRSQYATDREFWKALFEYETAVEFPTRNVSSGSVQCRFTMRPPAGMWTDATELIREQMSNAGGV